ncbi:MAG: MBL fold metallo-hydrolase [Peptococcaceae bacterium]|jgi:metallo-beta-lactamase family protein|nr:MBL fold metallo-hydrolase [Peptococcaceae bacterium]
MQITFYGAARVVTGSCYLIETGGYRLLIDCGMFQGSKALKELNYGKFPFQPASIDAVILTHAHIDHSGLLPKLIKRGFRGKIWATIETARLCEIMLPDSGHIQEMEIERKNRKSSRSRGLPLLEAIYTVQDALESLAYFQPVNYRKPVQLTETVAFEFFDAGHILGSAHICLTVKEENTVRKYIFSGDIGSADQPFLDNPSLLTDGDVVLMETTYGDSFHKDKTDRLERLAETINQANRAGGNLIIPAFAVERTQDLLFYIQMLQRQKKIPVLPIYIDSPLAIAATKIFAENTAHFDEETRALIQQGDNPLDMENLHFSQSTEESKALNLRTEKTIIIAASGMADAGRIKHHLKHNLWRKDATVLFVGYQAEGTLGRLLLDGAAEVTIHGEDIAVRAQLVQIDGLSAHADQTELLRWLKPLVASAKQIILTHGEKAKQDVFAEKITETYGKTALIPELGETFVFSGEKVLRTPAAHPWLSPPESEQGQGIASPAIRLPVKKSQTTPKIGKKAKKAQVRRAYDKLARQLERLIDQGKDEQDLGKTLAVIEGMLKWLEGQK